VPHVVVAGGLSVTCPGCGGQAYLPISNLGSLYVHGLRRCRKSKRCMASFIVDEHMRGYIYRGERIGTEEWEQK
jgi:hypothetical protein